MGYNDILMTCYFCGKSIRFGEMKQVNLRSLTEEEVEEFKKKGKIPILLEFAMRCNKCEEKGILTTLDGYTVDTTPIETISKEQMLDMALDREVGRYRAEMFSKGRKK